MKIRFDIMVFVLSIIPFVIACFVYHAQYREKNDYIQYCLDNSISNVFVEVAAEDLELDPYEVAVVCKFASENELDLIDALVFLDGDLDYETANEIIMRSDELQREGF